MELIPQISSSPDAISLVKQFVQTIHERKDPLNSVLVRLYNALRSKSHRQRGNISLALFHLLRRLKSEIDPETIYEESKRILLKDSSSEQNRRYTLALFLAWNSMLRAGLFPPTSPILTPMMRMCHGLGNERICYRSLAYATLWNIIDHTYKDTYQFKAGMFKELVLELGAVGGPGHADSFLLWIKVVKKFPGLGLKKWAIAPVSSATLRSLSSVLESTLARLPEIHPIWRQLAEVDAMQFVYHAMEVWSNEDIVPAVASIAAFQKVDIQNFVGLLNRYSEYYGKVSIGKFGEMFNEAVLKAAESLTRTHRYRLAEVTAAVIGCVRSKQIGKLAGQLTDAETREVLVTMSDQKFESCLEFLWVQAKRESLEDSALVTELFAIALGKIETDEQRDRLLSFLGYIVDQITGDGVHWFTLLSTNVHPIGPLLLKSETDIIARALSLFDAARVLHTLVGLDHDESALELSNFDQAIQAASSFLAKPCEFCKAIGRSIASSSLSFIDPDRFASELGNDPLLLMKAISVPQVSSRAVSLIIAHVNKLPRSITSRPENLILNIDEATAVSGLNEIFKQLRTGSKKVFLHALAGLLIAKLGEAAQNALIDEVVAEELRPAVHHQGDVGLLLIKSSESAAQRVLDCSMTVLTGGNRSPAGLRRARGWLEAICERYVIDPIRIGDAVAGLVAGTYGDSRGERKRAEDAFGWAVGFMATVKQDVPIDGLRETLNQFHKSKSRTLQLIAKQMIGEPSETV